MAISVLSLGSNPYKAEAISQLIDGFIANVGINNTHFIRNTDPFNLRYVKEKTIVQQTCMD